MIRSKLHPLALSATLICAALGIGTASAQEGTTAVDRPLDTLVLIQDDVRDLHVGADLEGVYAYLQPTYGLFGAGVTTQYIQKATDVTLEPLLARAPKSIVRDAVVQATGQTLAKHGMTVLTTLFQDKPKIAQFQRFPTASKAQRWVLIEFDDSHDVTIVPVALTADLRQVRLSLRVSVYSALDGEMRKRLSVRNILFFGQPVDSATSHLAREHWSFDGATPLDSGLRTALSELMELAISDEDFGESAKSDDFVDLLAHRGPQRIKGRLIRYRDGKALIINRSGNLLVVPAARVL